MVLRVPGFVRDGIGREKVYLLKRASQWLSWGVIGVVWKRVSGRGFRERCRQAGTSDWRCCAAWDTEMWLARWVEMLGVGSGAGAVYCESIGLVGPL